MTKAAKAIIFIVILCFVLAIIFRPSHLFLTLVTGAVSFTLAPVAIHKNPSDNVSFGLFMLLAIFFSGPLKLLLGIDGFLYGSAVTMVCAGALWTMSMEWKRSWTIGTAQ